MPSLSSHETCVAAGVRRLLYAFRAAHDVRAPASRSAVAQSPGALDPTFDADGMATIVDSSLQINREQPQIAGRPTARSCWPAGRIGMDGHSSASPGTGSLDATFGTGGRVDRMAPGDVGALAVRADGKIFVAAGDRGRLVVGAFNANGTSGDVFGLPSVRTVGRDPSPVGMALQHV